MSDSKDYIAYLGIEQKDAILVLSKIYVLTEQRGQGIGQLLMKKAYERGADLSVTEIELYVVKENKGATRFYFNEGFKIAATINKEYKNGYVVQEYKMTKRIDK